MTIVGDRRNFLFSAGAFATGAFAFPGCVTEGPSGGARTFAHDDEKGLIEIGWPGFSGTCRFSVIGDTHLWLDDERGLPYVQYSRRMGGGQSAAKFFAEKGPVFERLLAEAKARRSDFTGLVGDIVSFPSEAGVAWSVERLNASGLDWHYIAGNHDWHYEGLSGSDLGQRAEWAPKRLSAFYRGANPLFSSRTVKGVRFVFIDNSTYEILPEQLAFLESELEKGDPTALLMHIALYVPGYGVIEAGCGHPRWGAANDPYWEIERRRRWPAGHTPTTYAFRERVFSAPNVIGVFAGHAHRLMISQVNGCMQCVTPDGYSGRFLTVTVRGSV